MTSGAVRTALLLFFAALPLVMSTSGRGPETCSTRSADAERSASMLQTRSSVPLEKQQALGDLSASRGTLEEERLEEERLEYWLDGPWTKPEYACKRLKSVVENVPGEDSVPVCMDNWDALQEQHKGKPCVVYDLGVRDLANFAVNSLQDWGCVVRSYDPSPITKRWWETEKRGLEADPLVPVLKAAERDGNYKFHLQAATEKDGDLTLYAYDWDQIATFRDTGETQEKQKSFVVPGKSFWTMLKENNDTFVDHLKVDIEGSEFAFLRGAFEKGCPPVEYIGMEYHTSDFDDSLGCPPGVKDVEAMLEKCGYKKYYTHPFWVVKDLTKRLGFDVGSNYFGHAGYCRTCWKGQ